MSNCTRDIKTRLQEGHWSFVRHTGKGRELWRCDRTGNTLVLSAVESSRPGRRLNILRSIERLEQPSAGALVPLQKINSVNSFDKLAEILPGTDPVPSAFDESKGLQPAPRPERLEEVVARRKEREAARAASAGTIPWDGTDPWYTWVVQVRLASLMSQKDVAELMDLGPTFNQASLRFIEVGKRRFSTEELARWKTVFSVSIPAGLEIPMATNSMLVRRRAADLRYHPAQPEVSEPLVPQPTPTTPEPPMAEPLLTAPLPAPFIVDPPPQKLPSRAVLVERAAKLIGSVRISDVEADDLVNLLRERIVTIVERSLAEF